MKTKNNLPSGFPLSDRANSDDFTLLFWRERLRNVHILKTHVLSHCSALNNYIPLLMYAFFTLNLTYANFGDISCEVNIT